MKHIKEEYGEPCNLIESTLDEFYIMKHFLEVHGIEARICSICNNRCIWQIRNGYEEWAHLYSDNQITGQKIIDIVENDIKSGVWCR